MPQVPHVLEIFWGIVHFMGSVPLPVKHIMCFMPCTRVRFGLIYVKPNCPWGVPQVQTIALGEGVYGVFMGLEGL